MAKKNPGDILTGDWNPIIGCQRYSRGCRKCWFMDGIFPWLQRLGNLPADWQPAQPHIIEKRMEADALKPKNGIVGVVQHGDLFWDQIDDAAIERVLEMVDTVGRDKARKGKETKYVLWTKRAERMANIITTRYKVGVPAYLACGVSVEDQQTADERLPHLLRVPGRRFIMIEPMLGPIDLSKYLEVGWVVLGSETGGEDAVPLALDWARAVRDQVVAAGIPFFIKQLGNNHKKPQRELDGRTWDQFPAGFNK
jgi:protein gp37